MRGSLNSVIGELSAFVAASNSSLFAAEETQEPTIWEERAKERLKPLISKIQMRISQAQPTKSSVALKKRQQTIYLLVCHRTSPGCSANVGIHATPETKAAVEAFLIKRATPMQGVPKPKVVANLMGHCEEVIISTKFRIVPEVQYRRYPPLLANPNWCGDARDKGGFWQR